MLINDKSGDEWRTRADDIDHFAIKFEDSKRCVDVPGEALNLLDYKPDRGWVRGVPDQLGYRPYLVAYFEKGLPKMCSQMY